MPQFSPGVSKTAKVRMKNPTEKALSYNGALILGLPEVVRSEASFSIPALGETDVRFPVTMPGVAGTYPVFIHISAAGQEIALYRGTEDVAILAPPKFIYASDVRISYRQGVNYIEATYEVDIQNIGGVAGSCSPVGCNDWYNASINVPDFRMGTKTINPGEVVTFTGYWRFYGTEVDEWWFRDGGFIQSEAGCISYKFGHLVYPISFEIQPQIISGGEFWTTQVVRLAAGKSWIGWQGNLEGDVFSLALSLKGAQTTGYVTSIHALYPTLGDTKLLSVDSDYTIKRAFKAEYWSHLPAGYYPLPKGIYDVVSALSWSTQAVGYGHWHDRPIWYYKIGQVEVI